MASKFPTSAVLFKDTYESGVVTVRNIELHSDEDGFIEGPADLETDLGPHGFVRGEKFFAAQSVETKIKLARKYPAHFERLLTRDELAKLKKAA